VQELIQSMSPEVALNGRTALSGVTSAL